MNGHMLSESDHSIPHICHLHQPDHSLGALKDFNSHQASFMHQKYFFMHKFCILLVITCVLLLYFLFYWSRLVPLSHEITRYHTSLNIMSLSYVALYLNIDRKSVV